MLGRSKAPPLLSSDISSGDLASVGVEEDRESLTYPSAKDIVALLLQSTREIGVELEWPKEPLSFADHFSGLPVLLGPEEMGSHLKLGTSADLREYLGAGEA